MENNNIKWYNKPFAPYYLMIIPPLGLYALWRNTNYSWFHKSFTTFVLLIIGLIGHLAEEKPLPEDVIEMRRSIASFHPGKGPGEEFEVDSTISVNSGYRIYVLEDTLGWIKYRTTSRFSSNLDGWTRKENTTTQDDYEENYRERDQAVREIERKLREQQQQREELLMTMEALKPFIDANIIVNIEKETRTIFVNRLYWNSISYENKKLLAKSSTNYFDTTVRSNNGWAQIKDIRTGETVASYILVSDMLRLR